MKIEYSNLSPEEIQTLKKNSDIDGCLQLTICKGNSFVYINRLDENEKKFSVDIKTVNSELVYVIKPYEVPVTEDKRRITFHLHETEDFHDELVKSLLAYLNKKEYDIWVYTDNSRTLFVPYKGPNSDAHIFFEVITVKKPTKPEKYRCCYELKYQSSGS